MQEFRTIGPTPYLCPLPVVLLGCARPGETPNLVTVAWTGVVCSKPPMLSVSLRKSRLSHGILRDTGEFTVNLVSRELCRATDFCGVRSGREVDKFAALGLTPLPAPGLQTAPAVAQAPAFLSCRVRQTLELGSHDLFLAEVVACDVDESLLDETGKLCLDKAKLIVYSHGEYLALGKKLGTFGYTVRKKKPARKKK